MKKILENAYLKTYLVLLINLFAIEIIFKVIGSSSVIDFSTLRIFLGLNILSGIISFLLNFIKPNLPKKIITGIIIFAAAVYACAERGFYNFLGVYMSFQTSSQLGAVTDYIKDFIKSFNWTYFLTFIPFVLFLVFTIFFDKKKRSISLKSNFVTLFCVLALCVPAYYGTIVSEFFSSGLQSVSVKELFLTASNPSLTVQDYGSIGFCFLDVKAMLFPVTINEDEDFTYDETESSGSGSTEDDTKRTYNDTAWKQLIESEDDETYNYLNKYFISQTTTDKNDKTGLFEGKNLIVIMMESADDILINKDLYPNFYKMMSEGWYFENNYSPRNSCATMNNEFSGMTSLYSIYNTCTASKYKSNTYYESIFNLFNNEDNYVTFSVHDYTQAYYPRKTIHTNMGSGEYYGVEKLGISYSNEYKNWANDDEAMESYLNILDKKTANGEHFMSWFTTVSSHQPYGWDSIQGNKYLSLTKGTNYPTDVRRYMSKLKILDNALGVLLDGLEERGMLEDTVIVMFGDHYPYGINTSHLNKVLDYDTSEDLNAERVPLVIYNKGTTDGTVYSDYTFYVNLLPTLANLFNLDYDTRLYIGKDYFSDDFESLVVFADGSWKNEYAYYDASKSKIKYYTDKEYTQEEIKAINDSITLKQNVSSKAIKSNYFSYLHENLTKINKELDEQREVMCLNSEKDSYSLDEETTSDTKVSGN